MGARSGDEKGRTDRPGNRQTRAPVDPRPGAILGGVPSPALGGERGRVASLGHPVRRTGLAVAAGTGHRPFSGAFRAWSGPRPRHVRCNAATLDPAHPMILDALVPTRRSIMPRLRAVSALCLLSLLYGCGGTSSQAGAPSASDCSVAGEKAQILSVMQSWYYWYQSLPSNLHPANYASSNALLDAIRHQPLDRFSYITTQAANQSFYGAGQYVGYGLGFPLSASNNLSGNQGFP